MAMNLERITENIVRIISIWPSGISNIISLIMAESLGDSLQISKNGQESQKNERVSTLTTKNIKESQSEWQIIGMNGRERRKKRNSFKRMPENFKQRWGRGGACQQQKNGMSDGSFAAVKCANKAVKRRRSEASLASPLN